MKHARHPIPYSGMPEVRQRASLGAWCRASDIDHLRAMPGTGSSSIISTRSVSLTTSASGRTRDGLRPNIVRKVRLRCAESLKPAVTAARVRSSPRCAAATASLIRDQLDASLDFAAQGQFYVRRDL